MREILFRGKRVDNGEWIEGYYTNIGKEWHYILTGKLIIGLTGMGFEREEVIPETVGQYTGLKDKNGVRVCEGGIVKYENKIYEIKYLEKYARFAPSNEHSIFMVCAFNHLEVVGNIHDNPGLMRGE